MPMPDDSTMPADQLGERVAAAFLEQFVVDRALGRMPALVECLRRHPGHEVVVAREWLLATGAFAASGPTPVPTVAAHDRIGAYRLLAELGRGGQGVVYLAEDTRVARTVALKVFADGLSALGGPARLRFRREAEAVARLDHPGVATVFEVGEDRDTAWIAMRHVAGGSVQQLIAARLATGTGPSAEVTAIASDVRLVERAARALHAAHAVGIVHRDIKPGNILLQAPDEPVLADFGLAHDQRSGLPRITVPGAVFGTLCYLPPERLAGAEAGPLADLWALAAVLFELLTLQRPFQAATTAGELQAIANDEVRDPRTLNPAISRDLAVVLMTALARDLSARYRTAAAFADDLAAVLAQRPIAARAASRLDRLRHFARREPALTSTVAALLVVLVIGLVTVSWFLRENRSALAAVTRLADLKLARELRQRQQALWPARAERIAAMRAWLADAARLREHVPEHAALLAALPPLRQDPTADWQRDQLEALHQELADLDQQVAAVQRRIDAASSLRRRSIEEPAASWAAAATRVAANPRYDGLVLRPQLGLLPLGPDPASGLEEFAHLPSGAAPARDATGKLQIGEDSALVLILVPGGPSVLGCEREPPTDGRPANVDPETPAEQTPGYVVDLAPFLLSRYEMTQAQWQRQTGANPSTYRPDNGLSKVAGLQHPVELISWEDCERVLAQFDLRLPSEAQWEHAYRAGSRSPYPFGDTVESVRGHENLADVTARDRGTNRRLRFIDWLDDGHLIHAPIGSFLPNAWGFHDMGGNVKEWCDDSWEDYPAAAPRAGDGRRRGAYDRYRIIRGGSYSSYVDEARAGFRFGVERHTSGGEAGVRPARDLER
ncbi:MAG: SUMF1/EgtB/PvdO family nonheme iron enzyme [Planctomycetes bacterium]|nr:SUMF1/EgtB/PvdO family nonheme iron enzyme [Planctomycetota bacterium]